MIRSILGVLVVLGLGAVSCSRHSDSGAGGGSSEPKVDRSGPHWVQDQQLRAVMGMIADQTRNWPAGLPDDPEDPAAKAAAKAYSQAILVADGLANAAEKIPTAVAGIKMSDADRQDFAAQAAMLKSQAMELRKAAEAHKLEQMQRTLTGITATCSSCHIRYRDFSGDLWLRKADAGGYPLLANARPEFRDTNARRAH
jgi:cytochrome c556